MSSVEERVKKIVAEQLGVKEEEVKNGASVIAMTLPRNPSLQTHPNRTDAP